MQESSKPQSSNRIPLAMALKHQTGTLPRVVAQGRGAIAEAIVAKARENGVAIEEDPVLAEALASVDLDAEIPMALFLAVAEVLSYVLGERTIAPGGQRLRP